MVVAIGFLSIVTALITSTFIQAAQRQQRREELHDEVAAAARTEARLEELVQRLETIEQSLGRLEAKGTTTVVSDIDPGPTSPPTGSDATG
jgi:uncharacterized membrane protein